MEDAAFGGGRRAGARSFPFLFVPTVFGGISEATDDAG